MRRTTPAARCSRSAWAARVGCSATPALHPVPRLRPRPTRQRMTSSVGQAVQQRQTLDPQRVLERGLRDRGHLGPEQQVQVGEEGAVGPQGQRVARSPGRSRARPPAMPSLIASRDTTGQPRAAPTAYASVVLPDPAGPVTRTSVGRPTRRPQACTSGCCGWSQLAEEADLLQLVGQRGPVGRVQPGHLRPARTAPAPAGCCRPARPRSGSAGGCRPPRRCPGARFTKSP